MYRTVFNREGAIIQGALVASAVFAFLSIVGFLFMPIVSEPQADMRIEPNIGIVKVGDTFVVRVLVSAQVLVNVFKGEIRFDPTILAVESIDYNTSIADLWAEKPWYENGAGTINFIGGTTRGGFLGTGELITITFRAHSEGRAIVRTEGTRILEHDGLGTDAVVKEPIDALFTVEEAVLQKQTIASPKTTTATIAVINELPSTDLNHDGKQTIADVSIFMLNMLGDDARFDLNGDGSVDTKDLSVVMSAH